MTGSLTLTYAECFYLTGCVLFCVALLFIRAKWRAYGKRRRRDKMMRGVDLFVRDYEKWKGER